jgi:hypothetical protein
VIVSTGTAPPDDVDQLAHAVSAHCPGFTASGLMHRSATSVLLSGDVWGQPAVAKLLISPVPFWRETFAREIDVYRFFERNPPPFRVPSLIAADEQHPFLVLERVDGVPVAGARYPTREIPPRHLAAVFTALRRVNEWRAPVPVLPRILDYRGRLERYRRAGQFTDSEYTAVATLLGAVGEASEFGHGDLMLRHVLRRQQDYRENDYALLDWAFASVFLPGLDLARLWTLLRTTFGVRSEIEDTTRGRGEKAWFAFLVNLAIVLAQELRTLREQPSGPTHDERLAGLEEDWLTVRRHLHAAAAHV